MSPFAIRMIALAAGALVAALGGFTYWRSTHDTPSAAHRTRAAPRQPAPEAPARPCGAAPSAPQCAAPSPAAPEPPSGPTPAASAPPQFDIVRVSPEGETVVAGRAPGASRVELFDGGKVIAAERWITAASSSCCRRRCPAATICWPCGHSGGPGGHVASNQSVAVCVRPGTSPLVTLAEPGKPSVVLAAPAPARHSRATRSATAASAPNAQAAIQTAEVEAGGRFFATGTAAPGSTVRLYLNGSHVADAGTADDGKWSLTITKG